MSPIGGGGGTIFRNLYFPDSACGVIFCNNNTQATNSAFRLVKTISMNPRSVEFTSVMLNHIRFVFYNDIKDNKRDLCQDLLKIENTDLDLKVHTQHYANELLVHVCVRLSFQKHLQTRSTCRDNMKKCLGKE